MRFKLDEHTAEVLRKSIPSVIVKIIGVISSIFLSVFLARELGAEGIGIIGLSERIVTIVIVIGLFGSRPIIIKEIAIARGNGNVQRVGDIMKSALFLNGGITFILSILMIFIAPWMSRTLFNEPKLTFPLMISLVVITPQVLSRIYSAGLTGSKKIWQSSLVDNSLSVLISIILLLFAWFAGLEINIINVAVIHAIGRIFVTMTVMYYWRFFTRESYTKASIGKMNMFKRSYLFFFISSSDIIKSNIDVLMLGVLQDSESIGLYMVASRIALMTTILHHIVSSALSPKIAVLYSNQKVKELRSMVKTVTGGLTLIGLLVFFTFVLYGNAILGIWGETFQQAYWGLVILGIGQVINLSTGGVGIILTMTGHEKIQSKISLLSLLTAIVLSFILIRFFGVIGAAIATSTIVIGENIAKYVSVKRESII